MEEAAKKARVAAQKIAKYEEEAKNECLKQIKSRLLARKSEILAANEEDLEAAKAAHSALLIVSITARPLYVTDAQKSVSIRWAFGSRQALRSMSTPPNRAKPVGIAPSVPSSRGPQRLWLCALLQSPSF